MLLGLCNSPATFQRTVDILLSHYKWRSCLVCLGDILVFSDYLEDHLRHVDKVLTVFRLPGVPLKLERRKLIFYWRGLPGAYPPPTNARGCI